MSKIVIVGPAPPFRGGIADFNEAFANSLVNAGHDVEIISFTLQYPSILFPGKSQYKKSSKSNYKFKINPLINSISPFSWLKAANYIVKSNPDIVLFRFWMPFFGPSFGTVARRLNKNNIRVVGLIDNAIPHEKRIGDKRLTKYFFNYCDEFITLSSLVTKDIYKLKKDAAVTTLFHPVYDVFGKKVKREDGIKFLELKEGKYLLFFGLIRDYKGLDLALEAMSHPEIKEMNIKLIVAGEFYGNKKKYTDLIDELQLDNILLFPEFVPSEEVANYFAVADAVLQPYLTATQSGITQVAYHFETPMILTDVGGLPEIVTHNSEGLICKVNSSAIAKSILHFYTKTNREKMVESVSKRKLKLSWETFVDKIENSLLIKNK
mgnify:CR=1 FL=1